MQTAHTAIANARATIDQPLARWAAVDKIPISSTAYGLFAHETAKESPASETGQVGEVERPKLELTPVQAVPHHRFVRRRQGGSGSVGNRPSDNFGR
jgi:hypothetical protein